MLLKEHDAERIQLTVSLSQLKKMYLALFRQLHGASLADFDELDEGDMLLTLQTFLQRKAAEAGIDGTIHSEWDRFLGVEDAPSCEVRFADRNRQE